MSDSYSAGKSFERAIEEMNTKCKKSKTGKHDWSGDAPYGMKVCKHCKQRVYTK